jgi:O-acetylserine/cysteine efflux transporter
MPSRDRMLAVLVTVLWGLNFPAIHLSLAQFPPYFLVALRFTLIAVPTLLFVRRPAVPLRWLVGYGVGFGVLQFVFLYAAMDTGMPPAWRHWSCSPRLPSPLSSPVRCSVNGSAFARDWGC